MKYESVVLTPKTPGFSLSDLVVRKIGRIVIANGYIINVSLVANSTVIVGYMTNINKPITVFRSLCGVVSGGGNVWDHPSDVAYFTIGTDNGIGIMSNITGTRGIYTSAVWIVQW